MGARADIKREIAVALKATTELFIWLEGLNLDHLYTSFVKQELYLDVLTSMDSKTLDQIFSSMKITNTLEVQKLRVACDQLKAFSSKRRFEDAIKGAMGNTTDFILLGTQDPSVVKTDDLATDLDTLVRESKNLAENSKNEGEWMVSHSAIEFEKYEIFLTVGN